MWTPRRISLLMFGLLSVGAAYIGYSFMFGKVDGLPPLPEAYAKPMTDSNVPLPTFNLTPLQTRLQIAFGPNCLELEPLYALKIEIRNKGMLLAAVDHMIRDDGRVQMTQVSVAIFGKGEKAEEISTIHCDHAILEFDQPIQKLDDMAKHKMLAIEMLADPDCETKDPRRGKIHITNNRRTPRNPEDDIYLTTDGPIYYRDDPARPLRSDSPPPPVNPAYSRLPNIWTAAPIELIDRKNRPSPGQKEAVVPIHTITADGGMRIYLADEDPKTAPKGNSQHRVGGAERIELYRNIVMHLWTENRSMFGAEEEKPVASPVPKQEFVGPLPPPPDKTLITIQTNGSFYFDMNKDFAHFERPAPDGKIFEYITVTRKGKGLDTLTCDYMDLQFYRKSKVDPKANPKVAGKEPPKVIVQQPQPKSQPGEGDLEIETLHAWGKDIAMSSESEKLDAYGYDLFYDSKGKQTILKGRPMLALKEGNQIKAKEMIMSGLDKRETQQARAIGPGEVGMGEFDLNTNDYSRKAFWKDELEVHRIMLKGRELNQITLTGGAEFRDTVNAQKLTGNTLRLWTAEKPKPKDNGIAKKAVSEVKKVEPVKEQDKTQLERLEAIDHVTADSPELIIHQTEYLNVWFKDVPPPPKLPGMVDPKEKLPGKIDPKDPPKIDEKGKPDLPPMKKEPKKDEKPKVPVELWRAKRVETWVNRVEGKNDLDKVHCEGDVLVKQRPSDDAKNGVHIQGSRVDMTKYPEGNHLFVTGNDKTLGMVQFDTIIIVCDDIKIDQRDNSAKAKGSGRMRLLSSTNLRGEPLDKKDTVKGPAVPMKGKEPAKAVPIDIEWDDGMELHGPEKLVVYDGRVFAKQLDSSITCENMQVTLDRPVILNNTNRPKKKEGEEDNNPKVERILCDRGNNAIAPNRKLPDFVSAEDKELKDGKLMKLQVVLADNIHYDNPSELMRARGPGRVRIFEPGSEDPAAPKGKNEKKEGPKMAMPKMPMPKQAEPEMKLTYVEFSRLMHGFSKERRAIFYGSIEVMHFPSERHDVQVNFAKLPTGGMYLSCQSKLEVETKSEMRAGPDGKKVEVKWQEMIAERDVRFRNEEYSGWSDKITYSEDKGLIFLYGTASNPAVMTQNTAKGGERKSYRGKIIKYWTTTKDVEVIEGVGGQN